MRMKTFIFFFLFFVGFNDDITIIVNYDYTKNYE